MAKQPIELNIKLKYEQELKRLQDELSKPLDLTFKSDTDIIRSIKAQVTDAFESTRTVNLDYQKVLSGFSTSLNNIISDASKQFSNITAKVNLDTGTQVDDLINKFKDVPLELKIEYQDALNELSTKLANSTANITVSNVVADSNGIADLIKTIQTIINDPEKGIQMFNRQSRINRATLVAFITRLMKEINQVVANDPKLQLKLSPDFKDLAEKIDKGLPSIEAAIKIPVDVDDTKLESLQTNVNSLLETIQEAISKVSFENLINSISQVVYKYVSAFGNLPTITKKTVDSCLAEIERISQMKEFTLPEVDQRISAATSRPSSPRRERFIVIFTLRVNIGRSPVAVIPRLPGARRQRQNAVCRGGKIVLLPDRPTSAGCRLYYAHTG